MLKKTLLTLSRSEVRTYRSADDLGPFERAVGTRFTGGRSLAVQLIVGVPFSLAPDKQNVNIWLVGFIQIRTWQQNWNVIGGLRLASRTWNMIGGFRRASFLINRIRAMIDGFLTASLLMKRTWNMIGRFLTDSHLINRTMIGGLRTALATDTNRMWNTIGGFCSASHLTTKTWHIICYLPVRLQICYTERGNRIGGFRTASQLTQQKVE